jgi:hypothetical protein
MFNCTRNITQLAQRINTHKEHLHRTLVTIAEKERELSSLKSDPSFEIIEERESTLRELSPEMESCRQKATLFFSPLIPIFEQFLKKYPDNSLVEDYVDNYLGAFYEDADLVIMSTIRKIWILADEDKLYLDEKYHSILRERADQTNSGELRELHKQYTRLKSALSQIEHSGDKALMMKVDDLYYRLDHFRSEQKKLIESISGLEKETSYYSELSFSARLKFESVTKEIFGEEIKVAL